MIVARHHVNQHYSIVFNTTSGFFARVEDFGWPEPCWSEGGPELMDIAVTNWCDRNCSFCYRRSNTSGTHMALQQYESVIRQAARMGVLQVALGGGNPNEHPGFCHMLELTRREFGIVPSYTTNGRGLSDAVLTSSQRFCGAVAVSAYAPYEEAVTAVRSLLDRGIKTNVHFVLTRSTISTAIAWLRAPPDWLDGINALIFLNFKPATRAEDRTALANTHPQAPELFGLATAEARTFKIGFDDCCSTGLLAHSDAHSSTAGACESGRFSMFVSEWMQAYPCSFMAELCGGHTVTPDNLLDIWRRGELFVAMRQSLLAERCTNCHLSGACLSGCPLFPEINFCHSACVPSPVQIAIRRLGAAPTHEQAGGDSRVGATLL